MPFTYAQLEALTLSFISPRAQDISMPRYQNQVTGEVRRFYSRPSSWEWIRLPSGYQGGTIEATVNPPISMAPGQISYAEPRPFTLEESEILWREEQRAVDRPSVTAWATASMDPVVPERSPSLDKWTLSQYLDNMIAIGKRDGLQDKYLKKLQKLANEDWVSAWKSSEELKDVAEDLDCKRYGHCRHSDGMCCRCGKFV